MTIALRRVVLFAVLVSVPYAQASFMETLKNIKELVNFSCPAALTEKQIISEFKIKKAADYMKVLGTVSAKQADELVMTLKPQTSAPEIKEKYLRDLIEKDDELYAYDGKLIRFRPSDSSIAVIPSHVENAIIELKILPNVADWKAIRSSWPEKHVYPSHPDLRKHAQYLSGRNSKWFKENGNFVYEVKVRAKKIGANDEAESGFTRGTPDPTLTTVFFRLKMVFINDRVILRLRQEDFASPHGKQFLDMLLQLAEKDIASYTMITLPLAAKAMMTGDALELVAKWFSPEHLFENNQYSGYFVTDK